MRALQRRQLRHLHVPPEIFEIQQPLTSYKISIWKQKIKRFPSSLVISFVRAHLLIIFVTCNQDTRSNNGNRTPTDFPNTRDIMPRMECRSIKWAICLFVAPVISDVFLLENNILFYSVLAMSPNNHEIHIYETTNWTRLYVLAEVDVWMYIFPVLLPT